MCAICLDTHHHASLASAIADRLRSIGSVLVPTRLARPLPILPSRREILGVRIPDSDAPAAGMALAQAALPAVLFNHSLRTFVLAMIDAKRRRLRVDEEACFMAAILHDLALVARHAGDLDKSFEENGAEFARAYALDRGLSAQRADRIAQAILLHAGQAGGMGADIEFVMIGAAQDVFGPDRELLSDEQVAAIEREVPRLGFKSGFLSVLGEHVERTHKPTWTAGFIAAPPPGFLANRWSE
jgi:HD domain-containing protein